MSVPRADLHPTDCLDWSTEPTTVRAAYDALLAAEPEPARPRFPRRPRPQRSTR